MPEQRTGDLSMTTATRIAVCAAVLSTSSAVVEAAPQAIEHFARLPQIRNVAISPDGRHIAFISSVDDVSVIMTFDRESAQGEFRRVAASEPDKHDLTWCRWANNERVLCSLEGNIRGKRYAEPPYSRLIAVDTDGRNLKVLQLRPDKANGRRVDDDAELSNERTVARQLPDRDEARSGQRRTRFQYRISHQRQSGCAL